MKNPFRSRPLSWGTSTLLFVAAAALFGASLSSSCTLVIDGTATQCEKDADCAKFPNSVCANHTCSGGGSCTTTAECVEQSGDGFVCKQFGTRSCVKLTNDLCPLVEGPYNEENAIFIGSVFPITGSATDKTGISSQNALRLALNEINEVGIPSTDGSQRHLVLVACNDTADKPTTIKAGQHLVDDLGIQAIVGASYSGLTLGLKDVTIPAGSLLISPSATSTSITGIQDGDPSCVAACGSDATCKDGCPGLLWRTSPSDIFQSAAIINYFHNIEDDVRTEQSLLPADKIKVAIAFKGDSYGSGLADAVQNGPDGDPTHGLRFNANALATGQSANFISLDYGNPDDPDTDSLKYPEVNSQLLAFHPNILLILGTEEAVSEVFSAIQGGLKTTGTHFLFSDGGAQKSLSQIVASDDVVRARILGTIPGTNGPNFQSFKVNFTGHYTDAADGSPFVFGAAGSYDIGYLLAYAAVGAGAKPLTGAEFARAFGRLVPTGLVIKAGTSKLNDGFNELDNTDHNIDFEGASGPLNFDLHDGEAPSDIQFWCIPDVTSADGVDPVSSEAYYDATNDVEAGAFSHSVCGF